MDRLLCHTTKRRLLDEEGKLLKPNDKECRFPLDGNSECEENTWSGRVTINDKSFHIHDWIHLNRKIIKKPYELMRYALEALLGNRNVWEDIANDIPKSWIRHGGMILFDSKSFVHPIWKQEGDIVWPTICICLNAEKLGRKYAIQPDSFRTPKIEMLWGDNSWVTSTDNKISYSWDAMKCMFSPGNAVERHRISRMDCLGETIVDLYAGIGYFTLPFLVHANASYVHACEWNPAAIEALRHNLKKNNVTDKCLIHEGDNRDVCPTNVADRVVMGLIPSCEQGIIPACKALKFATGGILHMHENVSTFTRHGKNEHSLVSPIFNNESLKSARELCEDCASILSTFPGGEMLIRKKIENEKEQSVLNGISINLTCKGHYFKPIWNTKSLISWKKKEWFIQAVHFSHRVCAVISNYHKVSWKVEVLGCHHVKSYAPHIDHLVFDLKCSPLNNS